MAVLAFDARDIAGFLVAAVSDVVLEELVPRLLSHVFDFGYQQDKPRTIE